MSRGVRTLSQAPALAVDLGLRLKDREPSIRAGAPGVAWSQGHTPAKQCGPLLTLDGGAGSADIARSMINAEAVGGISLDAAECGTR